MALSLRNRIAFAALAALFAGCAPRDEIEVYQAPSDPAYNEVRKPVILLAVIAPESENLHWVFKVAGPADDVAAARTSILDFLRTVEFVKADPKAKEGEPELKWKAPDNWVERPGDKFRYKSLMIPVGKEVLDLSISNLDKRGSRLLPNVNRWRNQVHRNPISEKELPLVAKKISMAGVEATLIEIKGFKVEEPQEREPFEYTMPVGWFKSKKAAFALLSFKAGDGPKRATVSVSSAGGTIDSNLNRWRDQVQLPPLDKEQLLKEAKTLKIAGQDGIYVDYATPLGKEGERDPSRILGVIVRMDDSQVFVKMTGHPAAVEQEKANFEQFATSLKPTKE